MVILCLERFRLKLLKNKKLCMKINGEDPMQNYFIALNDKKERKFLTFVFCQRSTCP